VTPPDPLYIEMNPGVIYESKLVGIQEQVVIDFLEDGRIKGIEILGYDQIKVNGRPLALPSKEDENG